MNYYLIGVGVKGILSDKPGEKELDFFYSYTDKDVKKAKFAVQLTKNEMWPVSDKEAIKMSETHMHLYLKGISLRAHVQGLMVCLYHSKENFSRKDFEILVKGSSLEELKKAEVRI